MTPGPRVRIKRRPDGQPNSWPESRTRAGAALPAAPLQPAAQSMHDTSKNSLQACSFWSGAQSLHWVAGYRRLAISKTPGVICLWQFDVIDGRLPATLKSFVCQQTLVTRSLHPLHSQLPFFHAVVTPIACFAAGHRRFGTHVLISKCVATWLTLFDSKPRKPWISGSIFILPDARDLCRTKTEHIMKGTYTFHIKQSSGDWDQIRKFRRRPVQSLSRSFANRGGESCGQ